MDERSLKGNPFFFKDMAGCLGTPICPSEVITHESPRALQEMCDYALKIGSYRL